MKAKVVYGCPCSGKSTYVKENAGENDIIYDYDALVFATTTRNQHLTKKHAAHFALLGLREPIINLAKDEHEIECIWIQCRWPTDKIREMLTGIDTEDVFIEATKQQCYDHLMLDETRPDKDEWKNVIDAWFDEHGPTSRKEDKNSDMNKFWNWIRDDTGGRVLRLEGPIDDESFWGDEVTPKAFREELESEGGDITVWINSPGGNVFAAAEIYTMLKEYAGAVTVRIASIAASAASVVAVAGDRVQMSPTALLMIHDPMTLAMGNTKDMEQAIKTLNEVKESIVNAYVAKTGLRRNKIAELMSNETWMNAKKAVELGFADEVLYGEKKPVEEPDEDPKEEDDMDDSETKEGDSGDGEEEKKPFTLQQAGVLYSSRLMGQTILNRIMDSLPADETNKAAGDGDEAPEEPAKNGLTEEENPKEEISEGPADTGPVIGMDGKTADGAMPFAILERELEYLR